MLRRAAESPDSAVARGVIRIPAERVSQTAQRRLASLMGVLLAHADPAVRLETLQRCEQLPIADADRAMAPGLLGSMGSEVPDESAAAAQAVFATYAGRDAGLVGEAFTKILPNRRALRTAVDALELAQRYQGGHLGPAIRAALAAMAPDPVTAALRMRLAAGALPPDELTGVLTSAAVRGDLHADALAAAAGAVAAGGRGFESSHWEQVETLLAPSPDDRLRRLAVTALTAAAATGAAGGWTKPRLARLQTYAADPSPLVAAAAQFTFPGQAAAGIDGDDDLADLLGDLA